MPASLCGLADRSDWLRNIHHTRTATIAADQPRRGMLMDACRAGGWGWGIFVQYSAGLILRASVGPRAGRGRAGGIHVDSYLPIFRPSRYFFPTRSSIVGDDGASNAVLHAAAVGPQFAAQSYIFNPALLFRKRFK